MEARNRYTSACFAVKRLAADRWAGSADRRANSWGILSAEHAVLPPRLKVEPYDPTIDDLRGAPTGGRCLHSPRMSQSRLNWSAERCRSTRHLAVGFVVPTPPTRRSRRVGNWASSPGARTSTRFPSGKWGSVDGELIDAGSVRGRICMALMKRDCWPQVRGERVQEGLYSAPATAG